MVECEKCVHSRKDAREEPCVVCSYTNFKYVNVHDALDAHRRALDILGVPAQALKDPDKAPPLHVSVALAKRAMGVVDDGIRDDNQEKACGAKPGKRRPAMSREIDARVAREVMGLNVFDAERYNNPGERGMRVIPAYSTDMNAAMEVVAIVCVAWGKFELHCEAGRWFAVFSRLGTDERISVGADTPALAICLAALEAVK